MREKVVAFHGDIDTGKVLELLKFRIVERGLPCAATAEDDDLAYAATAQCLQSVVGNIGLFQFGHGCCENARNIERNIAIPDYDGPLARQIDLQRTEIRMPDERKSTRLHSSHSCATRMQSSA